MIIGMKVSGVLIKNTGMENFSMLLEDNLWKVYGLMIFVKQVK